MVVYPPQGGRRISGPTQGWRTPFGPFNDGGRGAAAAPLGRAQLLESLVRGGLVLHFQPIIELASGAIRHHEALLRLRGAWGEPLLSPTPLLRAAEHHGLAAILDRRVLALAVGELRQSDAVVAVNLSALSLCEPDLVGEIGTLLERNKVAPEQLIVEITETAAIPDLERARRFCEGVRALGVQVAIDDFGVGCNSLRYLRSLPFDMIKIDGLFIRSLASSDCDRLVVKAVVDVARGLGKETVAEYVSDVDTVELLRALGVDHAQGFALGRPRPGLVG